MSLGSSSLGSATLGSSGAVYFDGTPSQLTVTLGFFAPSQVTGVEVASSRLSIPLNLHTPSQVIGVEGISSQLAVGLDLHTPSQTAGAVIVATQLAVELGLHTPDQEIGTEIAPTQLAVGLDLYAPSQTVGVSATTAQLAIPVGLHTPIGEMSVNLVATQGVVSLGFYEPVGEMGVALEAEQLIIPILGLADLPYIATATQLAISIGLNQPTRPQTAAFPPAEMSRYYDSSSFALELDDPASKLVTEGGYTMTRPKYLRRPRRNFTVGFSDLNNDDKEILEEFWNDHGGSGSTFTFSDPSGGADVKVRFNSNIKFDYRGYGDTIRWSVSGIKVSEV